MLLFGCFLGCWFCFDVVFLDWLLLGVMLFVWFVLLFFFLLDFELLKFFFFLIGFFKEIGIFLFLVFNVVLLLGKLVGNFIVKFCCINFSVMYRLWVFLFLFVLVIWNFFWRVLWIFLKRFMFFFIEYYCFFFVLVCGDEVEV